MKAHAGPIFTKQQGRGAGGGGRSCPPHPQTFAHRAHERLSVTLGLDYNRHVPQSRFHINSKRRFHPHPELRNAGIVLRRQTFFPFLMQKRHNLSSRKSSTSLVTSRLHFSNQQENKPTSVVQEKQNDDAGWGHSIFLFSI